MLAFILVIVISSTLAWFLDEILHVLTVYWGYNLGIVTGMIIGFIISAQEEKRNGKE